jgi:hypothetical protein
MLEAPSSAESWEASPHNPSPRAVEKTVAAIVKPTMTSTDGHTTTSRPTTALLPIVAATGGRGASASHVFATTSAG